MPISLESAGGQFVPVFAAWTALLPLLEMTTAATAATTAIVNPMAQTEMPHSAPQTGAGLQASGVGQVLQGAAAGGPEQEAPSQRQG